VIMGDRLHEMHEPKKFPRGDGEASSCPMRADLAVEGPAKNREEPVVRQRKQYRCPNFNVTLVWITTL